VGVSRQPPVDAARNQAFVFVGRLEDYKGPQLLAQAASLLGLPVIFCGTGPMEAELKRIYPAAEFTGWLAPDQVIAVLAKARAFVFPSVYRETFGLSAAEALARGIPVVASRETAAEEFVHHQENGLLFEHNSVDSLGFQLSALSDDGLVERLGRAAYEGYWESPLTVAAHVSRLRELYLSVVTGRNPASGIGMGIPDGTFRSA
jgi:glycosyltransferase involved in cell wall biosynthesis